MGGTSVPDGESVIALDVQRKLRVVPVLMMLGLLALVVSVMASDPEWSEPLEGWFLVAVVAAGVSLVGVFAMWSGLLWLRMTRRGWINLGTGLIINHPLVLSAPCRIEYEQISRARVDFAPSDQRSEHRWFSRRLDRISETDRLAPITLWAGRHEGFRETPNLVIDLSYPADVPLKRPPDRKGGPYEGLLLRVANVREAAGKLTAKGIEVRNGWGDSLEPVPRARH